MPPSRKYDIYIQLMRGETTVGAAAARAGVDRSAIMRLQQVARQGALEALAASRPGVSGKPARNVELAQARAEIWIAWCFSDWGSFSSCESIG